MSRQVNGFLAADGTFFEKESNCRRYESQRELEGLCDSHGVNFENFMATLNAWHKPIQEYYNADQSCADRQVKDTNSVEFAADGFVDESFDIPAFLPDKGDHPNAGVRDKDAPGFLEQQIRKHK